MPRRSSRRPPRRPPRGSSRRSSRGGIGRRLRLGAAVLAALCGAAVTLAFGNDALRLAESRRPSVSHGTPARGSLERGKRLPTSGRNFVAYSRVGALLGRGSVHSAVRRTVLDAYQALAISHPDVRWVYGETGWPRGGPFPPHRTHQNGLSVDFMVPVRNAIGRSERLPTWPWYKFGYGLDFDATGAGRGGARGLTIDFPAVAAHLAALADAAPRYGLAIDAVIFAPELERELLRTPEAQGLRGRVPFWAREPWVRHDDHYHVNFRLLRVAR